MLADGHDLVVVGGGDGGLRRRPGCRPQRDARRSAAGHCKHFARTLQIPNNLAEPCAAVSDGKVVDIDLGRANGEPFLNVESAGLSVAVTEAMSPRLKRYIGPLSCSVATLRAHVPWTRDAAQNHGFSLMGPAAEPWLLQPADWGTHAIERQQQDPKSSLALVTKALAMRRLLWKNEVFGPNEAEAARGASNPAIF